MCGKTNLTQKMKNKKTRSGSWDGTLRLWEIQSGRTTRRFVGHAKDVLSVAFSADNRQIVSGSRDKTIKLWNTLGECKYTIQEDVRLTRLLASPRVAFCVGFCPLFGRYCMLVLYMVRFGFFLVELACSSHKIRAWFVFFVTHRFDKALRVCTSSAGCLD